MKLIRTLIIILFLVFGTLMGLLLTVRYNIELMKHNLDLMTVNLENTTTLQHKTNADLLKTVKETQESLGYMSVIALLLFGTLCVIAITWLFPLFFGGIPLQPPTGANELAMPPEMGT